MLKGISLTVVGFAFLALSVVSGTKAVTVVSAFLAGALLDAFVWSKLSPKIKDFFKQLGIDEENVV